MITNKNFDSIMKWSSATFLGLAATAVAAGPPAGCSANRDGKFQVSIYSLGEQKRSLEVRKVPLIIHSEYGIQGTLTDNVIEACL